MPGGSLYTAAQLAASALAGDPRREESFETKPEYRAYQDEWFMTVTMGEHLPPTGDANRSKRWSATRKQRAKIEDQRARLPWTVDATDDRWYNTTLHAAAAAAAAARSAPGAEETAAHERDLSLPPGPVDSGMPAVRITLANAADYPPPSLNAYRTDASRAAADSGPRVWFMQFAGTEWDGKGHSYSLARQRWSRMADTKACARTPETVEQMAKHRPAPSVPLAAEEGEACVEVLPMSGDAEAKAPPKEDEEDEEADAAYDRGYAAACHSATSCSAMVAAGDAARAEYNRGGGMVQQAEAAGAAAREEERRAAAEAVIEEMKRLGYPKLTEKQKEYYKPQRQEAEAASRAHFSARAWATAALDCERREREEAAKEEEYKAHAVELQGMAAGGRLQEVRPRILQLIAEMPSASSDAIRRMQDAVGPAIDTILEMTEVVIASAPTTSAVATASTATVADAPSTSATATAGATTDAESELRWLLTVTLKGHRFLLPKSGGTVIDSSGYIAASAALDTRLDRRTRVKALLRDMQDRRDAADLRGRMGQPPPTGTPVLNTAALAVADSQADAEAAVMVRQLLCFECFDSQPFVSAQAILRAYRTRQCSEVLARYWIQCPAGQAALEETQQGFRHNVLEMGMPVQTAGRAQRVQLVVSALVHIGRLRVYGFPAGAQPDAVRHWLLQTLAAATSQPPPLRVLLRLTEVEFYLQLHALIMVHSDDPTKPPWAELQIFSEDPASDVNWRKFMAYRDAAGAGALAAHRYGHPGEPTHGLSANIAGPPPPPLDRTREGKPGTGGQILFRGAEALSEADQRALRMPSLKLGMTDLHDYLFMAGCGRTLENHQDLVDKAGSSGRYPSAIDASSPMLFTLMLGTPSLYLEPAPGVYQRVTSYPPSDATTVPDAIWGEGSLLFPHGGNAGNIRHMRKASWITTPWGNVIHL